MLKKICDNFAFQESSDSEVDTISIVRKSLAQHNIEASGEKKVKASKAKKSEPVFLASRIGRTKAKPLPTRVTPNVSSRTLPQSQPKEPCVRKVKAVCSDEFKPVLKPDKGAKDPPKPARAALVLESKTTEKPKNKPGRPKLPQRSGRPRKAKAPTEYEEAVPLELLEAQQDNLNTEPYTDSIDPFDDPQQQLPTDFELDPPFNWQFGDCHSEFIPSIELHPFKPPPDTRSKHSWSEAYERARSNGMLLAK